MLPRVNVVRGDAADYMLFSTRDAITNAIYMNGSWEEHMTAISRQFYDGIEAPLILDIGANLGGYSIPIAKELLSSKGTIYAYEPQRIIYYQLCGNIFLNRLDNVYAFNLALGDTDGTVQIPTIDYSASQNIGGFSIDEGYRNLHAGVSVTAAEFSHSVPILRLDNLVLPRPPSLIKLDVEGLELNVLKGGRKFLCDSGFPPILLEAWNVEWFKDKRTALLDFIVEMGYRYFQCGEEIIAQHPDFHRTIQFTVGASDTLYMERTR